MSVEVTQAYRLSQEEAQEFRAAEASVKRLKDAHAMAEAHLQAMLRVACYARGIKAHDRASFDLGVSPEIRMQPEDTDGPA